MAAPANQSNRDCFLDQKTHFMKRNKIHIQIMKIFTAVYELPSNNLSVNLKIQDIKYSRQPIWTKTIKFGFEYLSSILKNAKDRTRNTHRN